MMLASAEPGSGTRVSSRHVHQQQSRNHREIADPVGEEAPALADRIDQHARHGRPDHAGAVEHRGVQGDGVDQILPADHVHDKRLPRRDVEGVDDSQKSGEYEDVPHLDVARECQGRQDEGQEHGRRLRGDQDRGGGCTDRRPSRRAGASRKTGIWLEKPTKPSRTAEPVSR